MGYQHLDMTSYKRKNHFNYFKSLAYPYIGLTVNVKITELLIAIRKYHLPFFLTFNYCAANSLNQIPEFRQRILGDGIIEYEKCLTSHTVASNDGTYCYCVLDCNMPFENFLPGAILLQEAAKQKNVSEDQGDINEFIFISTLPWITYTSLIQPTPIPADSNPRITWGSFFASDNETFIPVTILANHALVDGLHISQFYDALNKKIIELTDLINKGNFNNR